MNKSENKVHILLYPHNCVPAELHHVVHDLDLGDDHLHPPLPDAARPQPHHLQEAEGGEGGAGVRQTAVGAAPEPGEGL